MTITRKFSEFSVGNCAVFERKFEAGEFKSFSELSGDSNPLHHDAKYAASSGFDRAVVPLHMTIAPLSWVAGMIFPGAPSLYLGHELRSVRPVLYGDTLTYSARLTAVNAALRTLTIRVLAFRDADVVMDANMRAMSRLDEWPDDADVQRFTPPPAAALVTGATGEIGSALSMMLARRGLNLVLVDRGPGPKRKALEEKLRTLARTHQQIDFIKADLGNAKPLDALCKAIGERNDIAFVFHVASPPLTARIDDLVQVNYTAMRKISEAAVPAMLMRQSGALVSLGSIATERVIKGWEDYTAAKAMAGQFVTGFDKCYAQFGVRGLTVLSGLVATAYSETARDTSPAMLPEELAESILEETFDRKSGQALIVEWNSRRAGRLGFHTGSGAAPTTPHPQPAEARHDAGGSIAPGPDDDISQQIAEVVRARLRLESARELAGGGVGVTPGWDSLRHIEILLDIEKAFGITFNAGEVENILTFEALLSAAQAHMARK